MWSFSLSTRRPIKWVPKINAVPGRPLLEHYFGIHYKTEYIYKTKVSGTERTNKCARAPQLRQ